MTSIFSPAQIGELHLSNRIIHSATYEGMATESGHVTEKLIRRYEKLASGEVGLIISGYMYVGKSGQTFKHQTGIYDDSHIQGLRELVDSVHEKNGKIVFQLAHAGRQTSSKLIGSKAIAPSKGKRDPVYFSKPVN